MCAAVLTGEGGVLEAAAPGALVIDSSTIDVATARAMHAAAAARGLAMLDAPVSGGVIGATAGTLTFMLGGSEADVARARPVLEAMGRNLIHAGGPGLGQAAKLCNNMMLAVCMIGAAEGFALAERLGLSAQSLFDIVSRSSGASWALTNHCPVPGPVPASPANRDYAPGFATALMLKDLTLAMQAVTDVRRALGPRPGGAAILPGPRRSRARGPGLFGGRAGARARVTARRVYRRAELAGLIDPRERRHHRRLAAAQFLRRPGAPQPGRVPRPGASRQRAPRRDRRNALPPLARRVAGAAGLRE